MIKVFCLQAVRNRELELTTFKEKEFDSEMLGRIFCNEQTGETEVPMMNPDKKNVDAQFRKKIILYVIFLGNTWSG